MAFAALITWSLGALVGLCLVAIWLIEYDESVSATRLPRTAVGAHGLLAAVGLALWYVYVSTNASKVAWAAGLILAVVTILGLTMVRRWAGVYRAHSVHGRGRGSGVDGPPERHFPLPVVIVHGMFACATIILVVLTALDIGGS